MRQVWSIGRSGSLGRLRREREAVPSPGPGEVLIGVKAIGLNLADVFACLGLYSATPHGRFIPGLECAGEVLAVDPSAGPWRVGQRVIALTRFGAYTTHLTVDARYLRALPDGWSFAEGAAFAVQALTAWYAVHELGGACRGSAVLVHSAAGGVGLACLGLLTHVGAEIVATVGRVAKQGFLEERMGLSPSQVVVRDARRFGQQLDAALGARGLDGFDLVLDAVMGPYFRPAFERLRPAGRHIVYGAADMMPAGQRPNWGRLVTQYARRPRVDPLQMISANTSVMGFNLIWLWDRVERLASTYARLDERLTAPPFVGHRYPFDEAPAALGALQAGGTVGKVVLEV